MNNVCGSTDTQSGEPCQRPAGWGTPSDMGECRDHAAEYAVPRKLDGLTREQIFGAAEKGAMLKHCAAVGGITPRTLRDWLSKGKRHVQDELDTPLATFYLRFQRARGRGAAELLSEASPEFILKASYGYTPTEAVDLDLDTSDSGESERLETLISAIE